MSSWECSFDRMNAVKVLKDEIDYVIVVVTERA